MNNPFDDEDGSYLVLANAERQHSLWPAAIDVPAGWSTVFGADTRSACLAHVEKNWTDMRPASLAATMDGHRQPAAKETADSGPAFSGTSR
ncbi:MbtH family protein [Streptomyces tagetis]|uniref:MbtH family protein n=1 Tax=Streptomyces tagetis TaxID=2820809 RepID=A0A940XCZ8_9ACTN|nr:MbtH family protein [Streptomyces sp. RG38]MBQ0828063.1 MbtH family protein [Streptomyces sp. RG38]